MGKAMASNLMKKGYTVTVYNRSKKSVDDSARRVQKARAVPRKLQADQTS